MRKEPVRKPTDDEDIDDADELDMPLEDVKKEMEEGNVEEDVYSRAGREKELDDDEISDVEEGFSEGADSEGRDAKCRNCGKPLMGPRHIVEKEIDGVIMRFCSNHCVEQFEE